MQSEITPSFGGFIAQKRTLLKLNQLEFSKAVKISPSYLNLIEKGNKVNPKKEVIYRIAEGLKLTKNECELFLDIHAKTNGIISLDLPEYLMSSDIARTAIRRAKDSNDKEFTDQEWQNFIDRLDEH